MESYMDVTYEVIDPITRESFFTKDNYVATHRSRTSGFLRKAITRLSITTKKAGWCTKTTLQ